jgi:UBX domain-containing protein 1/4
LIRRKRDQDSAAMIEEAKYKEQLRQIEKEKKLKRDELEAKKRVKEQIEADKKARREKVITFALEILTSRLNKKDWHG